MSLNIVFMGTPEFSIPTLDALIKNQYNIQKVYTQPPKKSKRGQKLNITAIEAFCQKNKINFSNPININNEEDFKILKKLSPDIVVVVAYGQIIPKSFLSIAKLGFINVHASLLPKWRGAAPIQRAIMNGDNKIGVSIMRIEEKLDSGPVLLLKEMKLNKNITHGELVKELSVMGADLLIESLKVIKSGKFKFINQAHSEATYAKKIEKSETKINWNLEADKVLSTIHSLSPSPGSWFEYQNERFKVLRAKISLDSGKPGLVLNESLTIACKSNSIEILELQRQGKNKQTAENFLLGNHIKKGTILN